MLDRLTPDQMQARLRESSPEELHAYWTGRDHRDAALAGTEVARRKAAGTYRLPHEPDWPVAKFLIREAHREFGFGNPTVHRLLLLDRQRKHGEAPWQWRQEVTRLLRSLYPGSVGPAEAPRAVPD